MEGEREAEKEGETEEGEIRVGRRERGRKGERMEGGMDKER